MSEKSYTQMPLTDTAIRNAKQVETPYSLPDERGLSLLVQPTGGKWWRLHYRFDGKTKMLYLDKLKAGAEVLPLHCSTA
jgi:hypothetical protein